MKNNNEIRTAWRKILGTLVNYGLDFFLQDEIDLIVATLKEAMEKNNETK